jgi:hypothetical protein
MGGFNMSDPINTFRIYNNPKVVVVYQQPNWIVYFDKLHGCDDMIALEIEYNFQNIKGQEYIIVVRGFVM